MLLQARFMQYHPFKVIINCNEPLIRRNFKIHTACSFRKITKVNGCKLPPFKHIFALPT